MDDKKNIIEISKVKTEKQVKPELHSAVSKVTNPITRNFIKYLSSSKGKFSIKDIFR